MTSVPSQISKYMGNAIKLSEIWGSIIYNVKAVPYQAKGDGVEDDTTSISAAINAASNEGGIVMFPPGTYITGNQTVPSNVTLWFANGAMLSIKSGSTVTINGPIEAGLYQIFSGLGTVSGNIKIDQFHPHWWGAKADGTTDDTAAIQKAINAANAAGGGIVYISWSLNGYLIADSIDVKQNVCLRGAHDYIYKADVYAANKNNYWRRGSTLLITGGAGVSSGQAIATRDGSSIYGLVFLYINQTDTNPPVVYPPTIRILGNGVSLRNLYMINPYVGIDATVGHQELYVENVFGQALNTGIKIDNATTADQLINVIWGIAWSYPDGAPSDTTKVLAYMARNAVGFDIYRADDIYMQGCFVAFYHTGIHLRMGGGDQGSYGRMVNCAYDGCEIPFQSDNGIWSNGWLIDSCHFIAGNSLGDTTTAFVVNNNPTADLRISNCGFWNPTTTHMYLNDAGTVGISNCFFKEWGANRGAIELFLGTKLQVENCRFAQLSSGGSHLSFNANVTGPPPIMVGCIFEFATFTMYKGIPLPGCKMSSCEDNTAMFDTMVSAARHTWKVTCSDAGAPTYTEI